MKTQIIAQVEANRTKIGDIAQWLYAHPEVAMQERLSVNYLSNVLENEGFMVERGLAGLDTAFRAVKKNGGGPRIAFIAEYDALPGNGHACGHHLISAMSLGAGISLAKALEQYPGEIAVIGTPGEELAEGKPHLLAHGVFDGYDAAMMIHPSAQTSLYPPSLCLGGLEFIFTGEAAHAGFCPDKGINALDAVVIFYTAVSALRQQLRDGTRVHGVILEGGSAVNIIPDKGRVRFEVRAVERDYYHEVVGKVVNCAQAAALATGCTLAHGSFEPECLAMRHNRVLGEAFRAAMEECGIADEGACGMLSTDMGNVSQAIPAIHPMLKMVENAKDLHTQEFLQGTLTPFAKERTVTGAKMLALTGLALLMDHALVARLRD